MKRWCPDCGVDCDCADAFTVNQPPKQLYLYIADSASPTTYGTRTYATGLRRATNADLEALGLQRKRTKRRRT